MNRTTHSLPLADAPVADRFRHAIAEIWRSATSEGCIAVPRVLIQKLEGDFKSALMLTQALTWSQQARLDDRHGRGWFARSSAQWQSATGLTPREQERTRQRLTDLQLMQCELTGWPARMHYLVDPQSIARSLGCSDTAISDVATYGQSIDLDRSQRLLQSGGRLLFLPKLLGLLSGDMSQAWLLSHFLGVHFWSNVTHKRDATWFAASHEVLTRDTGLTENQLAKARIGMHQRWMLMERRHDVAAPIEYQLCIRGLAVALREHDGDDATGTLPYGALPHITEQIGRVLTGPGASYRIGALRCTGRGRRAKQLLISLQEVQTLYIDAKRDQIAQSKCPQMWTKPTQPPHLTMNVKYDGAVVTGRYDVLGQLVARSKPFCQLSVVQISTEDASSPTFENSNISNVTNDLDRLPTSKQEALSQFAVSQNSGEPESQPINAPRNTQIQIPVTANPFRDAGLDGASVSTISGDLNREGFLSLSVDTTTTSKIDAETKNALTRVVVVVPEHERTQSQLADRPLSAEELIWPPIMERVHRTIAIQSLQGIAHADAQSILDEIGFIARSKPVRSPIGLLRHLLRHQHLGQLELNGAHLIAEQRRMSALRAQLADSHNSFAERQSSPTPKAPATPRKPLRLENLPPELAQHIQASRETRKDH